METALYLPVKRFLENLGFTVKGEVGGCDLVALSGDDPPIVVIGELKLSFNLELVLQAVDRAGACDEVWLAAKMSSARQGTRERCALSQSLPPARLRHARGHQYRRRRSDRQAADDRPRRNPKKRSRLVAEHQRRKGDPALGGSTRAPIMTAYRQQALACASALSQGPRRVRDLKPGDSGRAENPAAQCLWLVRSRRARHLRPDRCRPRRAETLAATADRFCDGRRLRTMTGKRR